MNSIGTEAHFIYTLFYLHVTYFYEVLKESQWLEMNKFANPIKLALQRQVLVAPGPSTVIISQCTVRQCIAIGRRII